MKSIPDTATDRSGGVRKLVLPETLDRDTAAELCRRGVLRLTERASALELDAAALRRTDGAGLALLWVLRSSADKRGIPCTFLHLPPALSDRLDAYARAKTDAETRAGAGRPSSGTPAGSVATLGAAFCAALVSLASPLMYLGELLCGLPLIFSKRFRMKDCLTAFRSCAVGAVPVMSLIGFLLGLILAFQSAIPLKMFGGEGFVGGLVGIALVRELGLIIAAILMAGRSGSAFAAELGTMKVNEEIDALETMGLQPVRFLVLPRVVAGTVALPFLSLFATAAGLIGGWLVMTILGFSLSYYIDQLQAFVSLGDLIGSTAKAVVFGFMVSAVGCRCGLRAGHDAGAVGSATTTAVVTAIILLTVLEGVFAVLFFAMGW